MSDLDDIKRKYDLATLMEQVTGQRVVKNKIRCFVHADDTPSLHVYDDGHFKCFGCGIHGDMWDFLGYVWYGASYDVHTHLREVVDRWNDPDMRTRLDLVPPQRASTPKLKPTLDPAIVDRAESLFKAPEEAYWRALGIPAATLYQHRVGFTGNRWMFPWYYRGILIAVKLRRADHVAPGLEPKYISVTGSRFAAPYNIDAVLERQPDRLLIVEDEKSVLAATANKLTAIACPANAFKAEWVELLVSVPEIVIVADNDGPGIQSAEKIRNLLRRGTIVTTPTGKDLFDHHVYLKEQCGELAVVSQAIRDWMDD